VRWKRIAGLVGLLIVALVVILYVIVTTYDFNKLKPRIVQAVRDATGRELTLGGDFKVRFGLSPSASVERVTFQNAPWGSRPEMVRVKSLEIQVSLLPLIRGEIEFKRLILVEPDIWIETDPAGKSNLEFKPPEKPKAEEKKAEDRTTALPPLIFEEVRIEKGVLTYRDGKKGKTQTLNLDHLAAAIPGGEKPADLHLQGSFNGRKFEVKGTTGPIRDLFSPQKPWPLNLTAKLAEATLGAEGSIREPLKGKGLDLAVRAEGPSIRGTAEFAGWSDVPELGAYKVSARIKDLPGKIAISDLKAQIGESDVSGSVEVNLSGPRPGIGANLSSSKLDLRPLFPPKDKKALPTTPSARPAATGKEKVFPSQPLPLDGLKALDGEVKIQAGQILGLPMTIQKFNARVLLQDGNLLAKPFQMAVSEGSLSGLFNLRTQGKEPSFNCDFKLEQLDVASLLKDLGTQQVLEGKVSAEVDLNGKGRSIAEWMGGLNGRTFVTMGKGRLNNKYLNLIGADMAESILRLVNPFKKGEDFTPVNCLVNGFDIQNGLAVCKALVLDTQVMSVMGEGNVNLKEEKLNLSIHPTPKEGLGTGGLGKISLSLGELTKSFKLGGTLAKPSLAIDTTQALVTAGKAVGGVALFGPAGILGALASPTPGDPNPCLTAYEKAKMGKTQPQEKAEKKPGEGKKSLEDVGKGVGQDLKKLFGK
jgi:uncharacterized protein involved in outer membrane biogenesis